MVFGWLNSRQRSTSIGSETESRRGSMEESEEERPLGLRGPRISMDSPLWVEEERWPGKAAASTPVVPQVQARRRSIFEVRAPFGSDRFSREYADAMDDMWMAGCEQGDAGRMAGPGTLGGSWLGRRVALGQDEFSREYFDAMEDTFVAETDHGDSGFLRQNPHQPTFNRIPDALRRVGENLYRPVKVGSDEFSREYAREGEDVWLAGAGKGPSGRASAPSQLMQRVRLGSDGLSR